MNECGVSSVDYNDKPENKINLNVNNDAPQIFRTLRNIDLNLLTIFEAVYVHKGIVNAAKVLNLTPSAISQSIQKLRLLFPDPLFIRKGQGVTPTAYATHLHEYISQGLESILGALDLNGSYDKQRVITIGTAASVGAIVMPVIYQVVKKTYPQVLLRNVAVTDANLLITGENGTGKEMLAREIHVLSNRKYKEMIAVDMGTITESLFESELFGHVKGSFTDAHTDRTGKFEAAEKSTLFLDEIGNLPYHLQAKLLTAIQRRSIVKVGSNTPIPIDIRLICATNRNLQEMVAKGEFREDLLYRINTIHVEIPPLRERKEDIIPLAERFMVHFCKQYDKSLMKFTPEAKDKLTAHPWYGNIRELEHVIEKAVIINDSPLIPAELFQLSVPRIAIQEQSISTLEEMEVQMIRKALDACAGNLSAVAAQLGITRQTLYNKMKKFGL